VAEDSNWRPGDERIEKVLEFIHPRVRPLSEILLDATENLSGRVTVNDLILHLSTRGLAPLILLMGLLNIVTIIPGSSTILGMPLVFLGLSLLWGARVPWLPRRIRNYSFDHAALDATVRRALPVLRRIERLARPRFWPGADLLMDRLYGALVLVFGLMVTLPIPFGNVMPAISITLVSLGFTARDGLWVAAGLLTGALALGLVIGVTGAVGVIGLQIFG
jgi:hypothetical protein